MNRISRSLAFACVLIIILIISYAIVVYLQNTNRIINCRGKLVSHYGDHTAAFIIDVRDSGQSGHIVINGTIDGDAGEKFNISRTVSYNIFSRGDEKFIVSKKITLNKNDTINSSAQSYHDLHDFFYTSNISILVNTRHTKNKDLIFSLDNVPSLFCEVR